MSFLCDALCGLLHNQTQKDVLCELYVYYVKYVIIGNQATYLARTPSIILPVEQCNCDDAPTNQ